MDIMVVKNKTNFFCNACGAIVAQWSGQCMQCAAWNTISEERVLTTYTERVSGHYAAQAAQIISMDDVVLGTEMRMDTVLSELNRVLGGGLVDGSVVLRSEERRVGKECRSRWS